MKLNDIILKQIHLRLIDEGIHRILRCLELVSEEDLYWKPNETSNSIMTLILHLDGNVRQWLLYHIGNQNFKRMRNTEFDESIILSKSATIDFLEHLEKDILSFSVDSLALDQHISIQGFEETILGAIIHVIEHFSYHTGQITYITKLISNKNTGYYDGLDLNII